MVLHKVMLMVLYIQISIMPGVTQAYQRKSLTCVREDSRLLLSSVMAGRQGMWLLLKGE